METLIYAEVPSGRHVRATTRGHYVYMYCTQCHASKSFVFLMCTTSFSKNNIAPPPPPPMNEMVHPWVYFSVFLSGFHIKWTSVLSFWWKAGKKYKLHNRGIRILPKLIRKLWFGSWASYKITVSRSKKP